MFAPSNKEFVSYSILNSNSKEADRQVSNFPVISIGDLIKDFSLVDKHSILKLDIEGCEFEVIKEMFNLKFFPQQIIIEIDELYVNFFKYYKRSQEIIKTIFAHDYEYVGNDHAYDFTFYRKFTI